MSKINTVTLPPVLHNKQGDEVRMASFESKIQRIAADMQTDELMKRLEDDAHYMAMGGIPSHSDHAKTLGLELLEFIRRCRSSERALLIAKAPK